ncbi:DMT family transporter [uncultured Eudoraea sp.]|uniref:DMT family transporter n=1 Tax=uncultured Eudoraea sp. TaxID=1035614 RepID=UPI00262F4C5A|nr:DMT family transporter [uncultured Eudoraea sp.]
MLDLALSVLFSSLIFVIFKLYDTHKIQTIYAIIVNYITACLVGILFYNQPIQLHTIPNRGWFYGTLLLGVLFIVVFNLMARTSQRLGVSVASVATKMSFVIPVILGLILYNERLSFFKILGILLALAAVYFASVKDTPRAIQKRAFLLPVMVFLGSGIIDGSIKYLEENYVETNEFPIFSATVFAAAATTGLIFILIKSIKNPLKLNLKNVLGGIALGIPNFFSIFFLLRALQNKTLNSASIFTLNNVAIVMFSTLLGIILFREKISSKNWGGITLAVISIILVAFF